MPALGQVGAGSGPGRLPGDLPANDHEVAADPATEAVAGRVGPRAASDGVALMTKVVTDVQQFVRAPVLLGL